MSLINRLKVMAVAGLLALAPLNLSGCETVPATGERQFILLSEQEEIAIGEEAAPEFRREFGGELDVADVSAYVDRIGQQMATDSERPDLPWEFTVLDNDEINAFALPGGKIFITRGLMAHFENEAQLAAVLGHEIGHVTALHINQQMSRAMAAEFGLAAVGLATESDWIRVIGDLGAGVILLRFSREQESEADRLGLRYMTDQGYDPRGMLQVLEVLDEAAGRPNGIEWLQTHPLPQTRIDRVEQLIATDYAHTQDHPDFRLDAEAYTANVREPLGLQ